MIVLMAEEVGKGLKCDRGFKEKTYTTVAKVLFKRYKVEVRMFHIQNHMRHVKKVYMTIKGLLSVSGFGWDPHDKVIAADSDVWETYCQANPDARDFQGKSIDLFDEMGIVVGNDHARGSVVRAGSEAIPDNVPPEPYSSNQGRDDTESFVPLDESPNIHLSNTSGSFANFPNKENETTTSSATTKI